MSTGDDAVQNQRRPVIKRVHASSESAESRGCKQVMLKSLNVQRTEGENVLQGIEEIQKARQ